MQANEGVTPAHAIRIHRSGVCSAAWTRPPAASAFRASRCVQVSRRRCRLPDERASHAGGACCSRSPTISTSTRASRTARCTPWRNTVGTMRVVRVAPVQQRPALAAARAAASAPVAASVARPDFAVSCPDSSAWRETRRRRPTFSKSPRCRSLEMYRTNAAAQSGRRQRPSAGSLTENVWDDRMRSVVVPALLSSWRRAPCGYRVRGWGGDCCMCAGITQVLRSASRGSCGAGGRTTRWPRTHYRVASRAKGPTRETAHTDLRSAHRCRVRRSWALARRPIA